MKIDKIYKNPNNPRKISDAELNKLMKSIEKFPKMMELRPIIYNNEGMILGGNTRYEAIKKLGYKEIPDNWLKKANELTDKEQLEFIIKDNRLAGEFDYDILTEFFETDDLLNWGFEEQELGLDKDGNYEKQDHNEPFYDTPEQLHPEQEYILIICDKEEYDEARVVFGLGFVTTNTGDNKVVKSRTINYKDYVNSNSK